MRSPGLAFASVERGVIARKELATIKSAINVTWFFFLSGTGKEHEPASCPVAAFSQKQVWLITNNQFAYLS